MRDALPRRPHGWFGGGGVPASPGYPFIPGGAPAVFRNTIHTHTHTRAGFTEQSAWHAMSRDMYISGRIGSFARVVRCVRAMVPAARAHAVLGRICACLPGIASAIACSCAWLACSVVCANSAVVSKAGSIVHHMVCGMRACWMMLNQ